MTRQTIRPRRVDTIVPHADIKVIAELIDLRRWLLEQASPAPDPQ